MYYSNVNFKVLSLVTVIIIVAVVAIIIIVVVCCCFSFSFSLMALRTCNMLNKYNLYAYVIIVHREYFKKYLF